MQTRVVRPDLTIRWQGGVWRAVTPPEDWLVSGLRVQIRANRRPGSIWVCNPRAGYRGASFIPESVWLPEGF